MKFKSNITIIFIGTQFGTLGCTTDLKVETKVYAELVDDTTTINDTSPGPVDSADPEDSAEPSSTYSLVEVGSKNINGASIWNGLTDLDEGFVFSTMQLKDLTIRHLDEDLGILFPAVTVADGDDIAEGEHITDHAILRVEDTLYLAFGSNNLDDMYLLSTNLTGTRINLVYAQENGDHPTQDPHIFSDGEMICVRWGSDGFEKVVHCRSKDLETVLIDKLVTTELPIPKLGATVFHQDEFWTFTGDETQRNLLFSRYDLEYTALSDPFQTTILQSENNEWNWFCSGVLFIEEYSIWAIAYIHMEDDQQADVDGRGRLDIYDEDFNLLDRYLFGSQVTYRPHLLFKAPYLFLSYDNGPVSIKKLELIETDQ